MICYKDKSFCGSDVNTHTCGREAGDEDYRRAKEIDLPLCFGPFCNKQENQ